MVPEGFFAFLYSETFYYILPAAAEGYAFQEHTVK